MYAEHAKQNQNPDAEATSDNTESSNDSDVVDAEYKEVNNDKK